ncbi:hypothetical protein BDZ45DRAFT_724206 [Acephala macrosclerotiorum]|nr:hypothetical protein BDZ45DRAFT_724206 [Acephala macrosclerotiorum]
MGPRGVCNDSVGFAERAKTEEREVWAMMGTVGNIAGVILCRTHYIKMPGNSGFEEIWAVRLNRKTSPGDCGIWITDRTTSQVYRHIVAGDPNSCLVFIVSAYKVSHDLDSWSGIATLLSRPFSSAR